MSLSLPSPFGGISPEKVPRAGPGAGGRGQRLPPGGAVPAPPARGARGVCSRDQKRALEVRRTRACHRLGGFGQVTYHWSLTNPSAARESGPREGEGGA